MTKYSSSMGLIVACSITIAHAQDSTSTATGVFSVDQAKRGEAAYNKNCASCHGEDLHSTDREVSNLDGSLKSWIGKTVADYFENTRDTMPPREERSLDDQTYLDIVTYIWRFNKVPPGAQELKPELDKLRRIVIAPPPPS